MKWPWGNRYQVVLVGLESGRRTPVTFVRFRNLTKAEAWCARMNSRDLHQLTRWEPAEL